MSSHFWAYPLVIIAMAMEFFHHLVRWCSQRTKKPPFFGGDFLRMERLPGLPFLRSLFRWGPTSLANGDRRGKHTLGGDKKHDTKHNKKWGLKRTTWKIHSTTVRPSDSVPIAMRDSEKHKHCSLLSILGALESCHPMKISDASL